MACKDWTSSESTVRSIRSIGKKKMTKYWPPSSSLRSNTLTVSPSLSTPGILRKGKRSCGLTTMLVTVTSSRPEYRGVSLKCDIVCE